MSSFDIILVVISFLNKYKNKIKINKFPRKSESLCNCVCAEKNNSNETHPHTTWLCQFTMRQMEISNCILDLMKSA